MDIFWNYTFLYFKVGLIHLNSSCRKSLRLLLQSSSVSKGVCVLKWDGYQCSAPKTGLTKWVYMYLGDEKGISV